MGELYQLNHLLIQLKSDYFRIEMLLAGVSVYRYPAKIRLF